MSLSRGTDCNPRGDPGNLEFIAGDGLGQAGEETEGDQARGQVDREAKTIRSRGGDPSHQKVCNRVAEHPRQGLGGGERTEHGALLCRWGNS